VLISGVGRKDTTRLVPSLVVLFDDSGMLESALIDTRRE